MLKRIRTALAALLTAGAALSFAQVPAVQEPSSEEDINAALSGGVPMGRWKEGLLFEGLAHSHT